MSKAFNLLDEPWLPVRLADGRVIELGLLDTFARSAQITALAETAPPNLVAQYRLLLAITHRALSRAHDGWREKDRARWYREGLPLDAIRDYLEHWRDRFWLFHPEHPFMQVAALAAAEETRDKRKPWTQIALASTSGNTPVVFDHAHDGAPTAIRAADAIGTLLGFLQFTPGGLVKTLRDRDEGGALNNTAAVMPLGGNLAKTLLLSLHPFISRLAEEDLPAWERDPLTIATLRGTPVLATGPNDRYTRQSRAVLFLQEQDGGVRWLRFAVGLTLMNDPNAPDPMACFRASGNGLVRLTFKEGRAIWRDLPALLPNPSGESQAAAVLNHAIALHQQLKPFEVIFQPVLISGVTSEVLKMKVLRWRSVEVVLPSALLMDIEKALYLRELVEKADLLFKRLKRLAIQMLVESMPKVRKKEAEEDARKRLEASSFFVSYFATAERNLSTVLHLIGKGQSNQAASEWNAVLRHCALLAWDQVLESSGCSPRALRADAMFVGHFHGLLNQQLLDSKTTTSIANEAST